MEVLKGEAFPLGKAHEVFFPDQQHRFSRFAFWSNISFWTPTFRLSLRVLLSLHIVITIAIFLASLIFVSFLHFAMDLVYFASNNCSFFIFFCVWLVTMWLTLASGGYDSCYNFVFLAPLSFSLCYLSTKMQDITCILKWFSAMDGEPLTFKRLSRKKWRNNNLIGFNIGEPHKWL